MLATLRRGLTKKYPKLRDLFLPVWVWYFHTLWLLRNIVFLFNPIKLVIRNDFVLILPEGHIPEVLWSHGFEEQERHFLEKYLKLDMCVINVGANIGLYTLIAGKVVGPKGFVHAFEPSSLNFDRLKRNVSLNQLNNVILNHFAVSDFVGDLAVMRDPFHPYLDSHFFVQRVENDVLPTGVVEIISCNTIDNYLSVQSDYSDHKVDMMIIDVEGAELSVLNGSVSVINRSHKLMIMVECTENIDELNEFLTRHGFSFFELNALDGNLKSIKELKRGNIFAYRQ